MPPVIHTTSNNGWWPALSPDGRWSVFGNQFVQAIDTSTGIIRDLSKPRPPSDGIGWEWGAKWLNPTTVAIQRQEAGNNRSLWLVDMVTGEWADTKLPTWWVQFQAGNGHVMAEVPEVWRPTQQPGVVSRFYLDDREVTPAGEAVERLVFDGFHFAHFELSAAYPFVVRRKDGTEVFRFGTTTDGRAFSDWFPRLFTGPAGDPWVFSTGGDRPRLHSPAGAIIVGVVGESHGCLSWLGDEMIVWTVRTDPTYDDKGVVNGNAAYVIGRKLSDYILADASRPGQLVRGIWQGDLDVRTVGGQHILSGFNGGGTPGVPAGTTTITRIPVDTPMEVMPPVPAEPPVSSVVEGVQRPVYCAAMDGASVGHLVWGVECEGDWWAWELFFQGKPAAVIFHDMRWPLDQVINQSKNGPDMFVAWEYGKAPRWATDADRSNVRVYLIEPATMLRLQELTGAALICYHDGNNPSPHIDTVKALAVRGVPAYISQNCYWQGNFTDTIWWTKEGLDAYNAAGLRVALVRGLYRGNKVPPKTDYDWPRREMQLVNRGDTDMINSNGAVAFDLAFGLDRPGSKDDPWFQDYWRQRVKNTERPTAALPVPRPPVVLQHPLQAPQIDSVKVDPPTGGDGQRIMVITGQHLAGVTKVNVRPAALAGWTQLIELSKDDTTIQVALQGLTTFGDWLVTVERDNGPASNEAIFRMQRPAGGGSNTDTVAVTAGTIGGIFAVLFAAFRPKKIKDHPFRPSGGDPDKCDFIVQKGDGKPKFCGKPKGRHELGV